MKTSQYVLLSVIIPKLLTFVGVKLLSLSFFCLGHKFSNHALRGSCEVSAKKSDKKCNERAGLLFLS